MPYSNVEQIPIIINEIKKYKPKSILDVGCGIGLYGTLIRIFLELYDDGQGFLQRLLNREWQIKLDAIEGFAPYLEFISPWTYDHVWNADVFDVFSKLSSKEYDMVIAIAILEHLEKDKGVHFLNEIKRISHVAIVSVPSLWGPQVVPANPLENHRSHWTKKDFEEQGFSHFLPSSRSTIAVYGGFPAERSYFMKTFQCVRDFVYEKLFFWKL